MKKQVSGPLAGILVVIVLAVIGYFAWKAMGPRQDLLTTNRGEAIQEQMRKKFPNMKTPDGRTANSPGTGSATTGQ